MNEGMRALPVWTSSGTCEKCNGDCIPEITPRRVMTDDPSVAILD